MKIKIKYTKSKQTLERFGNTFLTKEAIGLIRSL